MSATPTPVAMIKLQAPLKEPMVDLKTGVISRPWAIYFDQLSRKLNAL